MKKILIFLVLIFSLNTLAYTPPVYISNPETMECRYYFAGDAAHQNQRPEGFTITLGPTEKFESEEEVCNQWKCFTSKGAWDLENEKCLCMKDYKWTEDGCKPELTLYSIAKNKTFLTYDRMVMLAVIFILLIYIFKSKKIKRKIKK